MGLSRDASPQINKEIKVKNFFLILKVIVSVEGEMWSIFSLAVQSALQ